MASEIFGRQRECRFYTAGCGNKMVVSATGPRAANELGGPVIPGKTRLHKFLKFCVAHLPVKQEVRTKFNFGHACPK